MNYVGRPYKFPSDPPNSFDCWTLLKQVREDLGLPSPLPFDPEMYTPDNVEEAIGFNDWLRVEEPRNGDAVIMGVRHVGVWLDGRVMHAVQGLSVTVNSWAVIKRRWMDAEVRRP